MRAKKSIRKDFLPVGKSRKPGFSLQMTNGLQPQTSLSYNSEKKYSLTDLCPEEV